MGAILNIILTVFSKIFGKNRVESNSPRNNIYKVEDSTPNNAIMDARAAIIWICAIVLAIYWIPLYSLASFMFIKNSIMQGHLVQYPLDTKNLFEMIGSLLGLGGLAFLHKLIKK